MKYKKGEKVKHQGVPKWGPGEVLEDSNKYVKISFVGAGKKIFPANVDALKKISIDEANKLHKEMFRDYTDSTTDYSSGSKSVHTISGGLPGSGKKR